MDFKDICRDMKISQSRLRRSCVYQMIAIHIVCYLIPDVLIGLMRTIIYCFHLEIRAIFQFIIAIEQVTSSK